MTTGKRRHFRPQSHLKYFAGTDEMVLTYSVDGRSFRTKPINLGVEGRLYSTEETDRAPANDMVEEWMTRVVDGPTAPVLEKLSRGNAQFTAEERVQLAIFFAAQDMRTPAVMEEFELHIQNKIKSAGKSVVMQTLDDIERERGPLPRDVREVVIAIPEPSIKNSWLQMMMRAVIRIAAKLAEDFRFSLFKSPRAVPWISNDRGIVKVSQSFSQPIPFVIGLQQTQRWMITMSPGFAVAMELKAQAENFRITPHYARAINAQIARDPVKQVYSSLDAPWIEAILRKRVTDLG